jgi:hypothetical protein
MDNKIRVMSQTYESVRAGARVQILQIENGRAKVRVVSPGWNQFEVYVVPKSIVS